jgi:hypothetical protein
MSLITFLLNQFILACFNYLNVDFDAYRILRHKTIAHGINLVAYLSFSILIYWLTVKPEFSFQNFPYFDFAVYLFAAFFNRQITFDIPLNLRRGLKWYYVSLDKPPKAWLDRQEVKFFGYNGKAITFAYALLWMISILVKILFL